MVEDSELAVEGADVLGRGPDAQPMLERLRRLNPTRKLSSTKTGPRATLGRRCLRGMSGQWIIREIVPAARDSMTAALTALPNSRDR